MKLLIEGGNQLFGTIQISGAKNACLPIIAATVLTNGKTVLRNVPRILDIENLLYILSGLGCKIKWQDGDLYIDTTNITYNEINENAAKRIRGSVFVLGSLIGRFKMAKLPYPGGCAIGDRPIDLHVSGFKKIGIKVRETKTHIVCKSGITRCGVVHLDFPSVGATENLILAAAIGNGVTMIHNAAREPEVVDLCRFLRKCGACIHGEGTDTIKITGVKELCGTDYSPVPDRIVTGSYMLAVASVGGDVLLTNTDATHNANLIDKLKSSGVDVFTTKDTIRIKTTGRQNATTINSIHTGVYPGFPTDLQSQFVVWRCLHKGNFQLTENLFEGRFKYIDELEKLGLRGCTNNRTVKIHGNVKFISGTHENPLELNATDLRGGVALVIAALAADGVTVINNANYIARGHENIARDLANLGANIIDVN